LGLSFESIQNFGNIAFQRPDFGMTFYCWREPHIHKGCGTHFVQNAPHEQSVITASDISDPKLMEILNGATNLMSGQPDSKAIDNCERPALAESLFP
jgi:hypothetical protein